MPSHTAAAKIGAAAAAPSGPHATMKPVRVTRPQFTSWFKATAKFMVQPEYRVHAKQAAGGAHSTATICPHGYEDRKSDALPTLPTGIALARSTHAGMTFKAGHLLNAQFGGIGTNAKNLTILTTSTNGSQRGFDEPVKRALAQLKKAYQCLWSLNIPANKARIGIAIDVRVSGEWGPAAPDCHIGKTLTCTATLTGKLPELKTMAKAAVAADPELAKHLKNYISFLNAAKSELSSANSNGIITNA